MHHQHSLRVCGPCNLFFGNLVIDILAFSPPWLLWALESPHFPLGDIEFKVGFLPEGQTLTRVMVKSQMTLTGLSGSRKSLILECSLREF